MPELDSQDNAEATSQAADNDKEQTATGADAQDTNDTTDSTDSGDATDDAANDTGDDTDGEDGEDSEDDDDSIDYERPEASGTGSESEKFDIRTLPRNEDGTVAPDTLNAAVEAYAQQKIEAFKNQSDGESQAKQLLTQQWERVQTKYPHLTKPNSSWSKTITDLHLNSVGTEAYLSPMAAAKRAEKMYREAVKSGVRQQTTKTTVERVAKSESSGGKNNGANSSNPEYQTARNKALSTNPTEAAQGRREIMRLRRQARAGQ